MGLTLFGYILIGLASLGLFVLTASLMAQIQALRHFKGKKVTTSLDALEIELNRQMKALRALKEKA